MTRSLSSPKAVERNHVAPSSSYTWPRVSEALHRALDPAVVGAACASLVQTSKWTPSRSRLASMPARIRSAAQVADDRRRASASARGRRRPDVVRQLGARGPRRSCPGTPPRAEASPQSAGCHRGAEDVDLAARIVEVVLARDAVARRLEDAAEQVADERAAGVADRERPGRVGRHELDVDVLGLGDRRATERGAGGPGGVEGPLHVAGREAHVDEARRRYLRARDDVRVPGDDTGEDAGDLQRWPPQGSCELQREVAGEVAVRWVGRPRDLDLHIGRGAQCSARDGGRPGSLEALAHDVTDREQGIVHGDGQGTAASGRSRR